MLFELRRGEPAVSDDFVALRDLFLRGQVRDAWQQSERRASPRRPALATDFVLLIEIARACGAHRKSLALAALAHRAFPGDFIIQLYHARSLLTRGRHWPAIQFLEQHEPQACDDGTERDASSRRRLHSIAAGTESITVIAAGDAALDRTGEALQEMELCRTLWAAQLASVYGDAGFDASCERWLATAKSLPGADSPLALYSRSCANHGMRRWDEASRLARRCIEKAPGWARARAYYVDCLLSQGKISEAQAAIEAAQQTGHRDATLELTVAMLAFSVGDFDRAESCFRALLDDWPHADFINWVRRSLCILLVELGRPAEAREVAGDPQKLALPELPETVAGRHRFIPLPLIAQNKNECVPTCVAMAAWPHGRKWNPAELFRAMRGRDGVPLWRMRQWAEEHDCRVVPIEQSAEAVMRLLDLNVPLIGVLEGPFNSHVEMVCGYHEDLDVLYVRDPMHWTPMAFPRELLFRRHELHGALLAIIPEENTEAIAEAHRFESSQCAALLDLARATALGDRRAAEAAYARIPDESPVAFLRDGYARCVVVSPQQFHNRIAALAKREDANLVARFRALLTLGSEESQEILEQLLNDDQGRLGAIGRRYLRLVRCMFEGQWKQADRLVEQMLVSAGSIAEVWDFKSDICAELGDQAGSSEALERAIELEPQRLSLRQKSLDRRVNQLTFAQYLAEFDDLLEDDPEEKRLLWGRALVLHDGPDGAAYERAIRSYLSWQPRDPVAYVHLRQWYLMQGREDLAERTLDDAHQLLPDVFPPRETEDGPEITSTPSLPLGAATQANGAESEGKNQDRNDSAGAPITGDPQELPDGHCELLDIAWNPTDERRRRALRRLLELEANDRLAWHERARLLACRLILGDDAAEVTAEDARQLLPASPPGTVHWFAGAVADLVTDYELAPAFAKVVIEWIEQVVPQYRSFPGLWFSRVLLLEKAHEVECALQELQAFLKHYPAHSSALYRMGVVKYNQQDYRSSAAYFRHALEVNPGLPGALHMLRTVCQETDDSAGALECTRRLRRKMPWSVDLLKDEVLAVADQDSVDSARRLLTISRDGFPKQRIELLEARLDLHAGDLAAADRRLRGLQIAADADEDLFEDYLQLRLSVALKCEDDAAAVAACDEGLARWPGATRLREIQANCLTRTDPQRARQVLEEVLCSGEPEASTVWQYLQSAEEPPIDAAQRVIGAAPEDRRQALAELFARVMSDPELLRWNATYLQWAHQEFPASDRIRWSLAMHYNMSGAARQAVAIAQELYDRNPDDPEALRVLGRCWIDLDARKALPYLEAVCEQNRSVDFLFDLARCCHMAGKTQRSRDVHWEILDQNPYVAASWTNLYLIDESPTRLWPYVAPFLRRGCGTEDEYCLVAVVKIALALRETVPVEWFPLAVQRLQILQTHPGFRDERPRLKSSVRAWLAVRPGDGTAIPGVADGLLRSLLARYYWPRCRWVPHA